MPSGDGVCNDVCNDVCNGACNDVCNGACNGVCNDLCNKAGGWILGMPPRRPLVRMPQEVASRTIVS